MASLDDHHISGGIYGVDLPATTFLSMLLDLECNDLTIISFRTKVSYECFVCWLCLHVLVNNAVVVAFL